jgi:hypothetical protein
MPFVSAVQFVTGNRIAPICPANQFQSQFLLVSGIANIAGHAAHNISKWTDLGNVRSAVTSRAPLAILLLVGTRIVPLVIQDPSRHPFDVLLSYRFRIVHRLCGDRDNSGLRSLFLCHWTRLHWVGFLGRVGACRMGGIFVKWSLSDNHSLTPRHSACRGTIEAPVNHSRELLFFGTYL